MTVATGTPEHQARVADLVQRLTAAGVTGVRTEAIPMRRWSARRCELRPVGPAVPVPYSARTGPEGVTGTLSTRERAGVIGLVHLPPTTREVPGWDGTPAPDPSAHEECVRTALARFDRAGAAGVVLVVDDPDPHLPRDGRHRTVPAVFARPDDRLREGDTVTLALEADIDVVNTHNLLGLVPGPSPDLVVLQAHTDGTGDGAEAVVAVAERLVRDAPACGVLVLLSTGHLAKEEAWGVPAFLAEHRDDLLPHVKAAVCVGSGPSFATPHRALVDCARRALVRAGLDPRVGRPFVPHDLSPDGLTWPGDGGPFWHAAGVPTLEAACPHPDALTEAVRELCATPRAELHSTLLSAPARG